MNVRHTLICFLFLSLQDENTGLSNAQITVYPRTEGGDVTVECPFSYSGSRKLFCREECQQKDVLIETTDDKLQRGRYSIEFIKASSTAGSLYVSITQLTKSDSGLYRCSSGTTRSLHKQIEIIVVDAMLDINSPDVTTIHERPGGNIIVRCSFTTSESRKYFCKDECKEKDILVETTGVRVQKGRYSIEFIKGSSTGGSLYVSITQLTKSDSGLYRCGWGTTRSTRSSYEQFRIIAVDALLDINAPDVTTIHERPGGNIIVGCSFTTSESRKYFCKDECKKKDILVETTGVRVQNGRYSIEFIEGSSTGGFLYVSITQLTKSDSGLYRCGLDRFVLSDPVLNFNIIVADPTTSKPPPAFTTAVPSASTLTATTTHTLSTTTPSTDVRLYVGVTLAVMVVLLALAVLIYCRKRSSVPKSDASEPPVETEYASVTETNRVYEDIREDRRNAAPMELSSVHTGSQNTADSSSKLTYSELNFSNRTAGSSNSAIHGDRDNVVYSVPRVEANAVYSTVS